jgi:hypothetical protein
MIGNYGWLAVPAGLPFLSLSSWLPSEKPLMSSLVTPFLRLNISYRRFRRTYTDEFQRLFPLKKARGWKREMLGPLNGRTVLVIEMTSFPVPRWALHFFLSPLFFPDRMPHLALLVSDWMALSTEMDSLRGGYQESLRPAPDQNPASSLLAILKNSSK